MTTIARKLWVSRSQVICLIYVAIILLSFYVFFKTNSKSPTRDRDLSSINKPDSLYTNYEEECRETECSKILTDTDARFPNLLFENRDNFIDLRRVLLIVQFNLPNYETASKAYAIYSRIFGRVVFCGPNRNESAFWPTHEATRSNFPLVSLPKHVRFYAMGPQTDAMGENGYYCLDLVMKEYYEILGQDFPFEGVMLAGEDVVLNYWTWQLNGKSLKKNWLMSPQSPFTTFHIDKACYCKGYSANPEDDCSQNLGDWSWHDRYREATKSFYNDLERLAFGTYSASTEDESNERIFWQQFIVNLTRVTSGARRRLHQGYADVFYVTKQYIPIVRPIFRLMNKHHLFMEFAVASTIRAISGLGLANSDSLQFIDSRGHDWGNHIYRDKQIADAYRIFEFEMFHPAKLATAFANITENPFEDHDFTISEEDPTADCVFCYLRHLSLNYAANVYSKNV